jgi:hypothetical protein
MLGGRRETVTVAAGHLQDAGLIHYTRGRLRIVNRRGLESAACECYRAVCSDGNRMLSNKNLGMRHSLGESPYRTRVSNALS